VEFVLWASIYQVAVVVFVATILLFLVEFQKTRDSNMGLFRVLTLASMVAAASKMIMGDWFSWLGATYWIIASAIFLAGLYYCLPAREYPSRRR